MHANADNKLFFKFQSSPGADAEVLLIPRAGLFSICMKFSSCPWCQYMDGTSGEFSFQSNTRSIPYLEKIFSSKPTIIQRISYTSSILFRYSKRTLQRTSPSRGAKLARGNLEIRNFFSFLSVSSRELLSAPAMTPCSDIEPCHLGFAILCRIINEKQFVI